MRERSILRLSSERDFEGKFTIWQFYENSIPGKGNSLTVKASKLCVMVFLARVENQNKCEKK